MAFQDELPTPPDENQLSLLPYIARCGYCGAQSEVPTRQLADRWAREHFQACERSPQTRNRRRDLAGA